MSQMDVGRRRLRSHRLFPVAAHASPEIESRGRPVALGADLQAAGLGIGAQSPRAHERLAHALDPHGPPNPVTRM